MKKTSILMPVLLWGAAAVAFAQAPAKVATIQIQAAIGSTKEGQQALGALETKFKSRQQGLEKLQSDINTIQSQMRAGSATMSEEAKAKLARDYDAKVKEFNRLKEDYQGELQQEQGDLVNNIGSKMLPLIQKYAEQNHITTVIDVSPQGFVLWADPSIDITTAIVKMYDEANPGAAPTKPAPAKPAVPTPVPPTKK